MWSREEYKNRLLNDLVTVVTLKRDAKDQITDEVIPKGEKALRISAWKGASHHQSFYSMTTAKAVFTNVLKLIEEHG